MRNGAAKALALGGVFAALAVVVMSMGTLIPVATFACPVICMMILRIVISLCGQRIGWAWYGAVTILSLLLAPDKEAAALFAALGYYPMLKQKLDPLPFSVVWKLLLFNASVLLMYWALMNLMGMVEIRQEFGELGTVMTAVLLLLGNLTFLLLDLLLGKRFGTKYGK